MYSKLSSSVFWVKITAGHVARIGAQQAIQMAPSLVVCFGLERRVVEWYVKSLALDRKLRSSGCDIQIRRFHKNQFKLANTKATHTTESTLINLNSGQVKANE